MKPFSSYPWIAAVLLVVLLLAPRPVPAAEATVILSQDCPFLLLDSSEGQMVVKMLEGEKPKVGDRLQGALSARKGATLAVARTGAEVRVWVDLVDRATTRALTRYAEYCQ